MRRAIGPIASCILTTTFAAAPAALAQVAPAAAPALRWYKGNTHTHTLNSDGDSTPDDVVRWYREHGYAFLVLTDHNFLTATEALNALLGADEQFLVIKGEEVTSTFENRPLHVNGLDVSRGIGAQTGTSVVEVVQKAVDGIRAAGGIPHINHPNFRWALTRDDLLRVRDNRLFEIYNGHPQVNNVGGGGVPGLEEVWDAILSTGTLLYGIAVDDAHTFKDPGNPGVAGPGRGWVAVRAPRLERRAIVEALDRGDFYASTGVELTDLQVSPDRLQVVVKPVNWSKYRVQFIAKGGRVVHEATEPTATYVFSGDEGYVRARVIESNGRMAWIQPVRVAPRAAARMDRVGIFLVGSGLIAAFIRLRRHPLPE